MAHMISSITPNLENKDVQLWMSIQMYSRIHCLKLNQNLGVIPNVEDPLHTMPWLFTSIACCTKIDFSWWHFTFAWLCTCLWSGTWLLLILTASYFLVFTNLSSFVFCCLKFRLIITFALHFVNLKVVNVHKWLGIFFYFWHKELYLRAHASNKEQTFICMHYDPSMHGDCSPVLKGKFCCIYPSKTIWDLTKISIQWWPVKFLKPH